VGVIDGVLVEMDWGMGVNVAGTGNGVRLGVTVPTADVALNKASTVCAAAVLEASSGLFEGRLHAPRNKAMMIGRLNRRVLFFMTFSPSLKKNFTAG